MFKQMAMGLAALFLSVAACASTTDFSFDQKLKAGSTYSFTFDVGALAGVLNGTVFGLGKKADPTFQWLTLDGVTMAQTPNPPPFDKIWSFHDLAVTAGTHTLEVFYGYLPTFGAAGTGPKGRIIGAFSFTPITTPVPEPQTYALFLAGLGMVGLMARRRQR
jgi:hypothetical protein